MKAYSGLFKDVSKLNAVARWMNVIYSVEYTCEGVMLVELSTSTYYYEKQYNLMRRF